MNGWISCTRMCWMNTGCNCMIFTEFRWFLGFIKEAGNSRHWTCGQRRFSIEIGVDTVAGEQATRELKLLSSSLSFHFSLLHKCILLVLCICCIWYYFNYFTNCSKWRPPTSLQRHAVLSKAPDVFRGVPHAARMRLPDSTGVTWMRLSRWPKTAMSIWRRRFRSHVVCLIFPLLDHYNPLKVCKNCSGTPCMQFRPKLYWNSTR